ncbi:hypothetical protein WG66_011899 [Moniliophthora roreri]|nr:hypothetical protein WG66_011899 [Moniliophthora roreri]
MLSNAVAFYALQLIGASGLVIIAFTAALSSKINRHPSWFSFCTSWIIACLSYSLLLLSGQANADPSYPICATQAALIYAAPALTGASTLAMFIYVYFTMQSVLSKSDLSHTTRFRMLLIIIPYFIWAVIFVALFIFSAKAPDDVQKADNDYYCNFKTRIPKKTSSAIACILTVVIIVFEVIIGIQLRRSWDGLARVPSAMGMAVRVMIFGVVVILALALSIIYLLPINAGPSVDITLAIIPVMGVIIFGSQRDIINAWKFWVSDQRKLPTSRVKPGSLGLQPRHPR